MQSTLEISSFSLTSNKKVEKEIRKITPITIGPKSNTPRNKHNKAGEIPLQ
jgi:hypothetical protein